MNFKIENGLVYVEEWVNKVIDVPNNMSFELESQEEWRLATITEIESIFKGGKDTLTKIGNKEVQSVQDEKNNGVKITIKHAHITMEDSKGRQVTFSKKHIENIQLKDDSQNIYQAKPLEEIEQNQKIVDSLVRKYKDLEDSNYENIEAVSTIKTALTLIVAGAGKDIKDF